MKKVQYQQFMEQAPQYQVEKRILFETEGDPLGYRLKEQFGKGENFLSLSRNAMNGIKTAEDITSLLGK